MNEHSYTNKLRKVINPHVSLFWKIKDDYQGGVPDIFIEGIYNDLWIETKYLKTLPKKPDTLIDLCKNGKILSSLQQKWLFRRYNLRKDTLVLVGHPEGNVLLWGISWMEPVKTCDFQKQSIPFQQAVDQILDKINHVNTITKNLNPILC